MKNRPILFSGAMVRAILELRKTQTRRVVKPQPQEIESSSSSGEQFRYFKIPAMKFCPYGQPGDRLWVRETWAVGDCFNHEKPSSIYYRSDETKGWAYRGKWRPSIFMPRWASRIILEIVSVRVERLQEISEEDAVAEGIISTRLSLAKHTVFHWEEFPTLNISDTPRYAYRLLWNMVNGKKHPWELNPWVWVVEFKHLFQEAV